MGGETRDRERSHAASLHFPSWQVWTERHNSGVESEGSTKQGARALPPPWAVEVLVHMGAAGPLAFADVKRGLRILMLGGIQPLVQLASNLAVIPFGLGLEVSTALDAVPTHLHGDPLSQASQKPVSSLQGPFLPC